MSGEAENVLRDTIECVLKDVHIESGTKKEWSDTVTALELAISQKIIGHEIDFYAVKSNQHK